MAKAKINYEEEEDILCLSKGKKIKESLDIGDFVIDIDMAGLVSGIEILNASENLKLTSEQLKQIEKASMQVIYKPNHAYIYLIMQFKGREKDITIPLTIDLGHTNIKTQNTNFAIA